MSNLLATHNPAELVTVSDLPADQNPALVYLASIAKGSQRTARQALYVIACLIRREEPTPADAAQQNQAVGSIPWGRLRFQHTQALRSQLAERYEPATARKMLSFLRGVLKAAWRLGQMSSEDHARAVDIASVRGSTVPAGRELTAGELAALMRVCAEDQSPAGARDAAIIAVAYAAGGERRAEVVGLELADYNPQTDTLIIRGKGHKERTAYLPNFALDALNDWLKVRGNHAGALFQPINKGGRLQDRAMTDQAIYDMLKKRAEQAGIADFSPHDLRRTFVSDLLAAGVDIATVAKMAGHANVQTTARYDRRPEEAKRKAASLLHVPYRKR